MKQFVFGLGNPGKQYANTRHNAGFLCLERLVKLKTGQEFAAVSQKQPKLYASSYKSGDILFAMPNTYMNDSGQAVRAMIEYYDKPLIADLAADRPAGSLERPAVIVMYDDLDIPLGQVKIQFGKGPKVHNGINSIRQHLGSDQFLHVRIGIDGRNGQRSESGSDYVLGNFYGEEQVIINQSIESVCQKIIDLLK